MEKLKAVIFISTFISCVFCVTNAEGNCSLHLKGKSLSLAPLNGTWLLFDDADSNGSEQYDISLCGPLNLKGSNDACRNSSVCRTVVNGSEKTRTSLADFSDGIYEAILLSEFSWLMLRGPKCLEGGRSSKNYQVILHFRCGTTIGSPELYLHSDCDYYFSWTTSAVCDIQPRRQEVPCYVYDQDTRTKHDLQPLIKSKGGHAVAGTGADSLIINVCSDIVPDTASSKCPPGAAACLERGGKLYSAGRLKQALSYTRYNRLMQITYEDDGKEFPPGCDRAPKTIITFLCPQQENVVHGPRLVASNNCHFEIIWEVVYACPKEAFSGNVKTCIFRNIYHGLEFDLSPLHLANGQQPYRTVATINNKRVDFFLNVCGGLGEDVQCNEKTGLNGWKVTSACMTDHESNARTNVARVIGTLKNARFHYTDGNISLVYTGSTGCNGTNAYWGTVINFVCDKSKKDGTPHFVGQEECLYIFDWSTSHACPKRYSYHNCSLTVNDSIEFDLQRLQRKAGWHAIDGTGANGNRRNIFLNVCGSLETTRCSSDATICLTDNLNHAFALGRDNSWEYDAENAVIVINYASGDSCGSSRSIQSKLKLFCKPGDTSSSPVLVKESQCYYEFEWRTSAACRRTEIMGQDCKIDNSGLQFDLSPLMSEKAYKAQSEDLDFFINVCAPVKGDECSLVKNVNASAVGGCATSLNNTEDPFSLGDARSDLVYKDGFLFLTYHSGPTVARAARNMSIVFVCDHTAGVGYPRFVEQLGTWFMYVFYWPTSHACLQRTFVDCTAVDSRTGVQYDLSSLTKLGKNASWSAVDRTGKRKFYLNICQPLLLDSSSCSGESAVCAVNITNGKEEKLIPNLGQAIGPPVVQSDGHLVLAYTRGDECVSYGKKVNYSATIHFVCHKSDEDQEIRFLGAYGVCNYSFLWATAAACSLESEESQNTCDVTDSVSGQTYNMMPLKLADNFYNVSKRFRLNICGPVGNKGCKTPTDNGSNVAVCELGASGEVGRVLGLAENYSLQVSQDMPVRLTYRNSGGGKGQEETLSVEIVFKCAEKVSDVRFLQQHGQNYYFEMATPLACKQALVYCSLNGPRGEHYDLTQLGRSPFKISSDTRPNMSSIHYQISFCSPLEYSTSSPCHGAGACQMNLTTPEPSEVSLGSQQRTPELLEDGSIIVRYTNGSKCEAQKNLKNSAEVKLHCSYKEHPVEFLGVESCKYKFSLETPAACFVQTYKGSNCAVTDLLSKQVFDLTPLKKEESNYKVKHEEYTYLLNVCDELALPPRGCEGFGVCQTKDSDKSYAVNAGMANQTLVYKDDLIKLTYYSGKTNCHKKFTRKSVITFVCDYTTDGIEEGPYFITEEEDCTYAFLWRTSYACRPYHTVDCTAQDENGRVYEIGTLALSTDNYYLKDPLNNNRTFAINVCRTLVSQPKFRCVSSSAACMLDKNSSNPKSQYPAESLGTKMESPKFFLGRLTMTYSLGERCVMFGKETHYETIIEFRCNVKEKFTTPEFIKQVGCKFFFLWETSVACPTNNRNTASNNCTVTDPRTGQVFNLTSLMSDKATKVKIGSTQQFLLAVCGSIPGSECGTVSGACQHEKGKVLRAGNSNSMLHYEDAVLYLNYTGGDKCNGGDSERNTVIQFMCSLQETSGPRFVSRLNDCTYTFVWYTPLACQKELPCIVEKDGATIDLSVLANSADAKTIIHSAHSRSSYFINVCSPLKPASNFCPPSAAICKVPFGTSLSWSLGRLWRSPYLDEEQKITIVYKEGSTCSTDETKRLSSRIIFLCDFAAGKGEPVFVSLSADQCEYVFEWRTSVVCTEEMLPKINSSQCIFEDKKRGIVVDLSKLWRNEKPYVVKSGNGNNSYLVNVCGGTRTEGACKKASVCAVQGNKYGVYGSSENSSLTMKGSRLLLTTESSEICYEENNTGKKKTEIIFTCDKAAGIGSPTLYKEFPCAVVLLWNTNVTCPQSIPKCTLLDGNNFYDLRMFSSISHSWSVIDKEGNVYWLNVCNEVQHEVILARNHSCPRGTAICRVGKDGKGISLGGASSQKLFGNDANGVEGITLQYQNGDEICTLANGSKVAASTRIRFLCDKSIQQPAFVKGPGSDCTYEFEWRMIGGCPENEPQEVYQRNGLIYHTRLPHLVINLTAQIDNYFIADEVHRDRYVYLFRIGDGVRSDDKSNPCYQAAVCQTKTNASFYRDLGSVRTRHFYLQGNDLKLVLTSHGKRCGKNNNKNVTTTITFHCAQDKGVGSPEFLYESNNCDYLFNWDTSATCNPVAKEYVADSTNVSSKESHISVSTEVIVGLVLSLTLIVVLIGVFAKEERRFAVVFKLKSCFHKVKLPRYRYIQSAHSDGDPILLSPDEPLQRFHEESDTDIIT